MLHDLVRPTPQPDGITIVVIDDNHALREVVKRALTRAGYRVLDWADPRAAIEHLARSPERIAMALVDGVMPEMLGPAAAGEIQRLRPDVPIMLMSGHEAPMFSDFFGRADRHFIAKPFVMADLVSRIARITGPPPVAR